MQLPAAWRERIWRWRRWIIAGLLLLAVRVALPIVLRHVIASQASQALHAQVDVGDVDLRLWRGGVALEDVAVRPLGAPTPPANLPTPAPDAKPPAFTEYSPIVSFKRFAVEVRFLPLFKKIIQLRDIELESPRVALDRLSDGDLNIMALVPKQEVAAEVGATPGGEPSPTPTAAMAASAESEASAWKFGLDRFVLKDGRIRFRDETLQGSEPVELGIDQISVDQISMTPEVYGEPARLHVKLGLDEGVIDVDSQLRLVGTDVTTTTTIAADSLPLRRARLYVPKVGWSELHGELDLKLTYDLAPKTKNELSGTLAVREVSVKVPNVTDAAVNWRRFNVDLEKIDLLNQRALVSEVTLDGAHVEARGGGGRLLLPLLEQAAPDTPAAESTPTPTTAPGGTEDVAAAGTAVPAAEPAAEPGQVEAGGSPTAAVTAASTPDSEGGAVAPTPTPAQADAGVAPAAAETATFTPESVPTPTPTPAPEASPPPEPTEPAKPWEWRIATLNITDSTLRVLSDQAPIDVGISLAATNLTGAADAVAHLALALGIAPGSIKLDGDLRIAAPAFGGTLQIADLSLPPLVALSGALPPEALPSAVLHTDLAIAAGLPAKEGAAAPADRLHVSGTLGLADLHMAPPEAGLTVDLKGLDLRLDQVSVPGVIPPGQKAAGDAHIDLAAELTLNEPHIVQTGDAPLDVQMQALKLTISALGLPAAIAKLGPVEGAQIITANLALALDQPHIARGGAAPIDVQMQTLAFAVPSLTLPAAAAGLVPGEGPQTVTANLTLELGAPKVVLGGSETNVELQRIALNVSDASLPMLPPASSGATPAAEGGAAAPPALAGGAAPAKLGLQLDLDALHVTTAQGKELDAGAKAIALSLVNIVVPGFVVGAPPAISAEPLRGGATLTVTEARAARGDGKEFAFGAKSIGVPLTELVVPGSAGALMSGAPQPAAQPMQLKLGEIRIEAPAIRVTRTKDGIVLPGSGAAAPGAAAPASGKPAPMPPAAAAPPVPPAPAAPPPFAVQVATFRVLRGSLDFTDRAVQPVFSTRYAPIEIDARNIQYPNLAIKPLKVDIAGADQDGHISVAGTIGAGVTDLTLEVKDLPLAPFNPYATTYSSYSIADGALSIKTTAKYKGGTYDVSNDITLHQFDLAGAEGDSLFEQQFGISLSMALALLRDLEGNIDLGVPVQMDEKGGATVDLLAVVRSALRQALTGAITSPLKMLGAAAGGKGAPISPAPIAFHTGTAQPTASGAENADRLAAFLVSRPAMAVELKTAATTADARWLHEQSLRAAWQDEGVFKRSLAFVTQRGPRERIRAYLEARGEDQPAELSAEDQATLDEWLAEKPAPSDEQLRGLVAARIAAVETVLRDKGIVAERMSTDEQGGGPAEGKPAVTIAFRPLAKSQAAGSNQP